MERNSREITLRPSGLQAKKRAKLTYIYILRQKSLYQ